MLHVRGALFLVCTSNSSSVEMLVIRWNVFRHVALTFTDDKVHVVVDVKANNHFVEWLSKTAWLQIKSKESLEVVCKPSIAQQNGILQGNYL